MTRFFNGGPHRSGRLVAAVVVLAAAGATLAAAPAGATSPPGGPVTPLYAYALGTAVNPTSCPADTTHNPSVECSLDDALTVAAGLIPANQIVDLATPGSSAHFVGNWTPDLSATTSLHPLTIQPAAGLSAAPVLDGNDGSSTNCPTGSCNDAILSATGPGFLSLSGVTMEHGNNSSTTTGGAIDNQDASVTVASVTFLDNSADSDGGAIDSADGATGTLNVTGSTFTSNAAASDGGAIDGADAGTGNTTVTNSTFTSNTAGSDGGAIDSADAGAGNLTVTGATFSSNSATSDGGAIDNADAGQGNLTVNGSIFGSNTAGIDGGAIDHADAGQGTATVGTSTVTGNTAGDDGGAIDNGDDQPTGTTGLTVTSSTLAQNTATSFDGGAIDSGDTAASVVTTSVVRSTLDHNTAALDGGAIDNGDGASLANALTLTDSTVTANSATTGGGGALDNADSTGLGSVLVSGTTISGNTAPTAPGIDNAGGTGSVGAAGDLLADACTEGGSGWTDAGYSAGDATCLAGGPGSVASTTVATFLGSLANNGGPTQTLLPLSGNAGIGLIPASTTVTLGSAQVALCPTTDQRGVASPAGLACTSGAVQVTAPTITSASHTTFIAGSAGSFTVHASGLPAPTYSESGPLPSGVSLNATTGVLSGTTHTTGTFPMTITAHNTSGADAHQAFTLTVKGQGYWLVGGDGGIFTFGAAQFYGSTGALHLQRPVVAITPTSTRQGYWLVASDGGLFAFGNAGYYGSIPGIGLSPAGTGGSAKQLNAPIVGMVPSVDGAGYFMVASDGGVFAFGDARYSGSCPAIGGCSGAAVAVMPDATGGGYWVVTVNGNVYAFGDAPELGQPGPHSSPVTSAVRTPDGNGYWILFANGTVDQLRDGRQLREPDRFRWIEPGQCRLRHRRRGRLLGGLGQRYRPLIR